ncbi:MAG: DNA-directed RNA polymerase I, subunit RPA34.5 [Benjaminiella poitrasii]|nr:MAG: DNA-directed RNA polymerase I, subunit RPA34.5 [Benjaminiella poitrasii]
MSSLSNTPEGFQPTLSKFDSPFDKEILLNDDKELWLIRIPDNMTEEDLANMKIKSPSEKATKKPLGKTEKNGDKYALYKVPTATDLKTESDEEAEDNVDIGISGQEMISLDCLVPTRENNGQLTFAPKKFSQYLILNQVVDIPDTTIMAQSILDKPVYKREQPEGLKMRFKPYGYYSGEVTTNDDSIKAVAAEDETPKKRKRSEDNDAVVKKEVGDDEGKKKLKKDKKKEKKDKKKDKKN